MLPLQFFCIPPDSVILSTFLQSLINQLAIIVVGLLADHKILSFELPPDSVLIEDRSIDDACSTVCDAE